MENRSFYNEILTEHNILYLKQLTSHQLVILII